MTASKPSAAPRFSPGPWKQARMANSTTVRDASGATVAIVYFRGHRARGIEEQAANQAAIAAVPTMVEALQQILAEAARGMVQPAEDDLGVFAEIAQLARDALLVAGVLE